MTIDFKKIRAANVARQDEWAGSEKADILFRALEVADEAGEVLGAIKKLVRAQRGIGGSTMTLEDVADEIGDAIISIDLLACELGIKWQKPRIGDGFKDVPPVTLALAIDVAIGNLSQVILQLAQSSESAHTDSAASGYIPSRIQTALRLLVGLAEALGIDAGHAVATKFNKTSAKNGLTTMMEVA